MLPASWNLTFVFTGTVAVHVNDVHFGVRPVEGFASFSDDVRSDDDAKPASI